jgi:glycosyltransferase involved in cell wall biosynthesis
LFLTIAAAFLFLVVLANALFWPRVKRGVPGPGTSVSVLIPARNEESNIAECIRRVANQGVSVSEILIYDDHSDDHTAGIVQEAGVGDTRVRLVPSLPLPPDWCGKNFACAQLASHAQGDWLLFLDADARLMPGAVDGMAQAAIERRLTLLSCWPGFDLQSFAERMLMPMLNCVVFTIFPAPLSLIRNEPSLGIAHGACLLIQRIAYEQLGGHGLVRNEIFEDTRLAQSWRARGERSLCLDGQDIVRVRMYVGLHEIWLGFQKNFFPAFRHGFMFWIFLVFHFTVFLLPFLLLNRSAAALIILARLVLAIRFGQPWWSALLHPFAEIFLLCLGFSSWWQCRVGPGVTWKGRVYNPRRV